MRKGRERVKEVARERGKRMKDQGGS